ALPDSHPRIPPRRGGAGNGPGLRPAAPHQEVPPPPTAGAVPPPAVLPRRQRGDAPRRGRALHRVPRAGPDRRPEARPGGIPEVDLKSAAPGEPGATGGGACFVAEFARIPHYTGWNSGEFRDGRSACRSLAPPVGRGPLSAGRAARPPAPRRAARTSWRSPRPSPR